jgi:outer membrane protein assembly factor BamA
MRRRFALFAIFALTARASFLAPPVRAQSSNLPHRCTILAETSESEKPVYPPIVIHDVKFDGKITLPESDLEQFVSNLEQVKFYASPYWTDEIGEVEGDHWRDQGYFQVTLRAEAQVFGLDSAGQHVFLTIHVNEGPQFSLKEVRFRKDDIVEPDSDASASEGRPTLRRKIPLSDESKPGTNAESALAFPSD